MIQLTFKDLQELKNKYRKEGNTVALGVLNLVLGEAQNKITRNGGTETQALINVIKNNIESRLVIIDSLRSMPTSSDSDKKIAVALEEHDFLISLLPVECSKVELITAINNILGDKKGAQYIKPTINQLDAMGLSYPKPLAVNLIKDGRT